MTIINMVGSGDGETPLEIQPLLLGTYNRNTSTASVMYYEATTNNKMEGYLPSNTVPIKGLGIVTTTLDARTSWYYNTTYVSSGTLTNKLIEWGFDKLPDGAYTLYYYYASHNVTEYDSTTIYIGQGFPGTMNFAVTNGVLTVTNGIDIKVFGVATQTDIPVYLWFNRLIKQ